MVSKIMSHKSGKTSKIPTPGSSRAANSPTPDDLFNSTKPDNIDDVIEELWQMTKMMSIDSTKRSSKPGPSGGDEDEEEMRKLNTISHMIVSKETKMRSRARATDPSERANDEAVVLRKLKTVMYDPTAITIKQSEDKDASPSYFEPSQTQFQAGYKLLHLLKKMRNLLHRAMEQVEPSETVLVSPSIKTSKEPTRKSLIPTRKTTTVNDTISEDEEPPPLTNKSAAVISPTQKPSKQPLDDLADDDIIDELMRMTTLMSKVADKEKASSGTAHPIGDDMLRSISRKIASRQSKMQSSADDNDPAEDEAEILKKLKLLVYALTAVTKKEGIKSQVPFQPGSKLLRFLKTVRIFLDQGLKDLEYIDDDETTIKQKESERSLAPATKPTPETGENSSALPPGYYSRFHYTREPIQNGLPASRNTTASSKDSYKTPVQPQHDMASQVEKGNESLRPNNTMPFKVEPRSAVPHSTSMSPTMNTLPFPPEWNKISKESKFKWNDKADKATGNSVWLARLLSDKSAQTSQAPDLRSLLATAYPARNTLDLSRTANAIPQQSEQPSMHSNSKTIDNLADEEVIDELLRMITLMSIVADKESSKPKSPSGSTPPVGDADNVLRSISRRIASKKSKMTNTDGVQSDDEAEILKKLTMLLYALTAEVTKKDGGVKGQVPFQPGPKLLNFLKVLRIFLDQGLRALGPSESEKSVAPAMSTIRTTDQPTQYTLEPSTTAKTLQTEQPNAKTIENLVDDEVIDELLRMTKLMPINGGTESSKPGPSHVSKYQPVGDPDELLRSISRRMVSKEKSQMRTSTNANEPAEDEVVILRKLKTLIYTPTAVTMMDPSEIQDTTTKPSKAVPGIQQIPYQQRRKLLRFFEMMRNFFDQASVAGTKAQIPPNT